MEYTTRPARVDDHAAIASFTTDTFDWGDYVADSFTAWVADPAVHVIVAVAPDDHPVALVRALMPAPSELWLSAARVHPDHRRQGLGNLLNEAGVRWGRSHGARVVRLLIEDWNEAPQRQVERMGYVKGSRWVFGRTTPEGDAPAGARLDTDPDPFVRADSEAVDQAFSAWSRGALAAQSGGLLTRHWAFWSMTRGDLLDAQRRGSLWTIPDGWIIADTEDGVVGVTWMQVPDVVYRRAVEACLHHAATEGDGSLALWLPADRSLLDVLDAVGLECSTSSVWAKELAAAGDGGS